MSVRTVIAGLCAVLLIAGCGDEDGGTGPTGGGVPGKLYVLNQGDNTMYIYDTETLARIDSIDTDVNMPHYIEFAPNGEHYYITTLENDGHFSKHLAATNELVSTVALPAAVRPAAIAITNDSRYGYLCNFSSTTSRTFIHKYDLTTMTWIKQLQAGATTHDLRITSDGATVVATNRFTDDITTIRTTDDDINFFDVDADSSYDIGRGKYGPFGVVIDHKDSLAFIACIGQNQVRYFDIATGQIVDSVNIPVAVEHMIAGPTLMAISPDDDVVYVTNQLGNSMVAFRVSTKEILANIPFETVRTFGISMSDDGSRVYVAAIGEPAVGNHGRVYIIDGTNQTKIDSLDVGNQSYGLIWQPE